MHDCIDWQINGRELDWQFSGSVKIIKWNQRFHRAMPHWTVDCETSMGYKKKVEQQDLRCLFNNSFFIFYFFYFLLYNIVLVLPYINMHLPWVYTCSPS